MSKLKARAPEVVTPGKTKALIYGPSGVGKTWWTLSFPKPYYFDTEGGADLKHYQERLKAAGGSYLGPEDGTLDFNFLLSQMDALATEDHPYHTLIIDSITKIYQTAIAAESERLGSKDAFGASKKPAVSMMRRIFNRCTKLDMNILFVAHEVSEWGIGENGQRTEIGKIPDVFDKLVYELDLTLYAQKRGGSRVAVVRKSRLTGFQEGDTFPLEYADFASRYGKDFIEAEVTKVVVASPEQITEIERIISVVKITDEEIDKVFTKAGVDSWKELSTVQAAQVIAWLNKKVTGK